VKVYREAVDSYREDPDGFRVDDRWKEELSKVASRPFCTGFYFGDPSETAPGYDVDKYVNRQLFIGKVARGDSDGRAEVLIRNKTLKGEKIEILARKGPVREDVVNKIRSSDGTELDFARPGDRVTLELNGPCFPCELLRRPARPES
jgi:putative protease